MSPQKDRSSSSRHVKKTMMLLQDDKEDVADDGRRTSNLFDFPLRRAPSDIGTRASDAPLYDDDVDEGNFGIDNTPAQEQFEYCISDTTLESDDSDDWCTDDYMDRMSVSDSEVSANSDVEENFGDAQLKIYYIVLKLFGNHVVTCSVATVIGIEW